MPVLSTGRRSCATDCCGFSLLRRPHDHVPRDFLWIVVYESRVGTERPGKRTSKLGVIFEQWENDQAGHQTRWSTVNGIARRTFWREATSTSPDDGAQDKSGRPRRGSWHHVPADSEVREGHKPHERGHDGADRGGTKSRRPVFFR